MLGQEIGNADGLIRPSFCNCTKAFQVSAYLSRAGTGQWIRNMSRWSSRAFQRPVEGLERFVVALLLGAQLAGDEQFVPLQPAFGDCLAHALLIVIALRRVDRTIPGLERLRTAAVTWSLGTCHTPKPSWGMDCRH